MHAFTDLFYYYYSHEINLTEAQIEILIKKINNFHQRKCISILPPPNIRPFFSPEHIMINFFLQNPLES